MEITPGHLCFSLPSQDGPVPGTTERLGIFLPSCQGARASGAAAKPGAGWHLVVCLSAIS